MQAEFIIQLLLLTFSCNWCVQISNGRGELYYFQLDYKRLVLFHFRCHVSRLVQLSDCTCLGDIECTLFGAGISLE